MRQVKLYCSNVHLPKSLDRRPEKCARIFKVCVSLTRQHRKAIFKSLRICRIVKEYALPCFDLSGHGKVYLRRAVDLFRVKGPLIAFQKYHIKRLFAELFVEEFAFFAVFTDRNIPWENLLIRSRQIPTKICARNSVLPFLKVDAKCTGIDCKPGRAALALGIDGIIIYSGGTACRKDNITATDDRELALSVKRGKSADSSAPCEYLYYSQPVKYIDIFLSYLALECLGHIF